MRAVVTGGAGFIGSHVVDALLARGDEVHVVDNFATGPRENVPAEATLHEGDIREPSTGSSRTSGQRRVHLAAQADVRVSVERPDYDAGGEHRRHDPRARGRRRHGARLVFSSTGGAIYGECDAPCPGGCGAARFPYGTSKLCGEEYLAT